MSFNTSSTRLLRTSSRQLGLGDNGHEKQQQQRCTNSLRKYSFTTTSSCLNKSGLIGENKINVEKNKAVAIKAVGGAARRFTRLAYVVVSEPMTQNWVSDFGENVSDLILQYLKKFVKDMPKKLHLLQMFIEKGILDCRFFSLFAVAGSLLSSLLCYVEGCYMILESYFHYFIAISHKKSDLGHVVHLLIEAVDMFLLGTAMLTFGMGLYVMFVGSRNNNNNILNTNQGSSQKLFYFEKISTLMGMKSVMQAKSRIGHALIMLLQVGVLEKFKNIPVVNGFDLACFAAAVFVSSLCVFLLSRLAHVATATAGN